MFNAWGKGKFDPRQNVDGLSKPVVIPPAYGLQGIHSFTFTGDGNDLAYWNRYVAVAEMGGLGTVVESRLNLNLSHGTEDRVSGKLPALQAYQLSLAAPAAPAGSFDEAAAARGKLVFEGVGTCATCHSGPLFTDANDRLHPASDSMAEPELAELRITFGHEAVPHIAFEGCLAAPAVLPRRLGRHLERCGSHLRPQAWPGAHRTASGRPERVPQVLAELATS